MLSTNGSNRRRAKWAIEGFVEAVAQEVAPFNIELTLIEPGPARTSFGGGLVSPPPMVIHDNTPAGEARRAFAAGAFPVKGELVLVLETILYAIGATLIVAGLVGAVVPALPGIPLMFAGIWLIARVDQYRHLGLWWLVGIALVGAVGLIIDLVAGALGATRVGASRRAVWGALLGTVIGLFFGLPGLLLGPFFGAVLGELAAGNSVLRSTHVGVGTWIGLVFGTLIKMVASLTMVALFAAGWWWNRP